MEFLSALKNPLVIEKEFLLAKILICFVKKLYINEGIDSDNDDVFRKKYAVSREKVKNIMTSR